MMTTVGIKQQQQQHYSNINGINNIDEKRKRQRAAHQEWMPQDATHDTCMCGVCMSFKFLN